MLAASFLELSNNDDDNNNNTNNNNTIFGNASNYQDLLKRVCSTQNMVYL